MTCKHPEKLETCGCIDCSEDDQPSDASAGYDLCDYCKSQIKVEAYRKWQDDGSKTFVASCTNECDHVSSVMKTTKEEAIADYHSWS